MTGKIIGIVGGVGPLAGLDLAAKIVANTRAARDQEHLPFVLASIPEIIGDRSEYLLGRAAENPGLALAAVAERLKAAGASVAGIPCNTAHAGPIFGLFEKRAQELGLGVVNMLKETASHLKGLAGGGPVAVLSTLGTWQSRVYDDYLAEAGVDKLDLGREITDRVHRAIYDPDYGIKSRSQGDFDRARQELAAVLTLCREQGAATAVLGCTELPLVFSEKSFGGLKLVDPTNILARALIKAAAPDKLIDEG